MQTFIFIFINGVSSNLVAGRIQICPFHCGNMNYAYSLNHLSDINLFIEQIFTDVGIYIVVDYVVYLYQNALRCIFVFHCLHRDVTNGCSTNPFTSFT